MPTNFKYDKERRILFAHVSGQIDPTEVRHEFQAVLDDPEIPSDSPAVWDLRQMDFSTVDSNMLRTVAADRAEMNEERGAARTAFVVTALDEEIIVRLYYAHTQHIPRETRVFRGLEKAVAWLEGTDREDLTA